MSKSVKIWLIVAASCVFIGAIMFFVAMENLNWDFRKLSTIKYENKKYDIEQSFKDIEINTDTADITLLPSNDSSCSLVIGENETMNYSVLVKDGRLTIDVADMRKWYNIGISFESPKLILYMPAGEYGSLLIKDNTGDVEISKDFSFESIDISVTTGDVKNYASSVNDLKIKSTTGDIGIENISAGSISASVGSGKIVASGIGSVGDVKLDVRTGNIRISDAECKNFISGGTTGDVLLKGVIAKEKMDISRNTGDIKLELCDAGEMLLKTTTGDVRGTLLSDKMFDVKTTTGKQKIPSSEQGGKCKISTGTGDVDISIKK